MPDSSHLFTEYHPNCAFFVEKEPNLAAVIRPFLSADVKLISAVDQRDLTEKLERYAPSLPALIFVDDVIDESPIELLRFLKRDLHTHDVVIVTGSMPHETVVEAMREFASDVIFKPVVAKDFAAFVKTRLDNLPQQSLDNYLKYIESKGVVEHFVSRREQELIDKIEDLSAGLVHDLKVKAKFNTAALAPSPEPKPTVLIVDDEEDVRENIRLVLRRDYEILTAGDGEKACEVLLHHPEVDVIFLDIHMPRMTGDVALGKLKAINPKVEIVMLTAFRETDTAIKTLKEGACDYLNKPADKQDIRAKIQKALNLKKSKSQNLFELRYERRLVLLKAFWQKASYYKHKIYYEDIFEFFPDAKKAGIHPHILVSPDVVDQQGLEAFVEALLRKAQEVESKEMNRLFGLEMSKPLNGTG